MYDGEDKPFNPTFGGYEWAKPGIMKQYACIKTYEDAIDVISNMKHMNPFMKGIMERIKTNKDDPQKNV